MNAFIPFDRNTLEKVTVKVIYLEPIPYEEYKNNENGRNRGGGQTPYRGGDCGAY